VPGQPSKNKIRPERTVENATTSSSVLSGRIVFSHESSHFVAG
jgi:hypothetical protein